MTCACLDLVLVGIALGAQVDVATCGAVHGRHLAVLHVAHNGGRGRATHKITCVTLGFARLVHGLVALVAQMHFTFRTVDAGCLATAKRLRLTLDAATQRKN